MGESQEHGRTAHMTDMCGRLRRRKKHGVFGSPVPYYPNGKEKLIARKIRCANEYFTHSAVGINRDANNFCLF